MINHLSGVLLSHPRGAVQRGDRRKRRKGRKPPGPLKGNTFSPGPPPGGNRREPAETFRCARWSTRRPRQIRLAPLAIGSDGVHLPASASTRKFQTSRLKASGSSIFTVWPLLANTARPALGITRLR